MKIVLIYSGGLDSTVLLYSYLAQEAEVKALSINYGQRHQKELRAAGRICRDNGVPFSIVDIGAVGALLQSSLTDRKIDVPDGHYAEESMKQTVVPNRNMIMLSLAIGHACSLKYDAVAYAAHAGDHTIYPDCRPAFVDAMAEAARLCDWHPVEIARPFITKTKADIAALGHALDVPFADTWSCYKGGERHCGTCGTCVERREAFELAKVPDPTEYENE